MIDILLALGGFADPPREYRQERPEIIMHLPEPAVDHVCRQLMLRRGKMTWGRVHACAIVGKRCILILPPETSVFYYRLLRHERAHCGGWRH